MRSAAGHSRPESSTADASRFYGQGDTAAAYTKAGATTQSDLTRRCLTLLGPLPPAALLADLGAGSGLSGAVLAAAGHAWVGLDVSQSMLSLARAEQPCASGAVVLSDFGDGLPFRDACLDGAVSVSALQWLCVASSGAARCAAFFVALRRALRPGAAAALQVYPADDCEAALLLAGAASAGFAKPLLCADFPHASAAKKLFLCVRKPLPGGAGGGGAPESALKPACALAWPRRSACCAAAWWQRAQDCGGHGVDARQRLAEEHGRYARRLLRLMRRGSALLDAAGDAPDAAGAEAAARALVAAFPEGASTQQPAWCCLRRVASVSAPPAHAAAAAAAADALRAAGWEVEARAAPQEALLAPAQTRFTGHKRDRPQSGSAAAAASNARRDELRAAAGAPPDAAFVALARGCDVRAGLLLSPDAAPHAAASALLRGCDAAAASHASLRSVALFERAALVPALALDLACRGDGVATTWTLLLLAAGPVDAQTSAAVAAALSELNDS